jgi:hypothetical protein
MLDEEAKLELRFNIFRFDELPIKMSMKYPQESSTTMEMNS